MVLRGYIAFLDPPKETALPAIEALRKHGVAVKVLTGDNDLVSRKICSEVGIPTDGTTLVEQSGRADERRRAGRGGRSDDAFRRLSPAHKQRIIKALQSKGPWSDHGKRHQTRPRPSVRRCGDFRRFGRRYRQGSANVILLEKSLLVLKRGYSKANFFATFSSISAWSRLIFGDMFSVLGTSALLPFETMAAIQILSGQPSLRFSQVPIPTTESIQGVAKPLPGQ